MKNNTAHYNGQTRLRNVYVAFLLGLLLLAPGAQGSVIFVDASQTNNPPDGTSWATAFPRVQQGIDAAAANDALWVAASVYFESLTVKTGVAVFGGFAGNESQVDQRNIALNSTILDGGQSNRVVTFAEGATNNDIARRLTPTCLANENACKIPAGAEVLEALNASTPAPEFKTIESLGILRRLAPLWVPEFHVPAGLERPPRKSITT